MEDNTIDECARRMQCTKQTVENRLRALARQGIVIEVRQDPVDKRRRLIAESDLQRIAVAFQEALLPQRKGTGSWQEGARNGAGGEGVDGVDLLRMELAGLKRDYERELELLRKSREQSEQRFQRLVEDAEAWLEGERGGTSKMAKRKQSP